MPGGCPVQKPCASGLSAAKSEREKSNEKQMLAAPRRLGWEPIAFVGMWQHSLHLKVCEWVKLALVTYLRQWHLYSQNVTYAASTLEDEGTKIKRISAPVVSIHSSCSPICYTFPTSKRFRGGMPHPGWGVKTPASCTYLATRAFQS